MERIPDTPRAGTPDVAATTPPTRADAAAAAAPAADAGTTPDPPCAAPAATPARVAQGSRAARAAATTSTASAPLFRGRAGATAGAAVRAGVAPNCGRIDAHYPPVYYYIGGDQGATVREAEPPAGIGGGAGAEPAAEPAAEPEGEREPLEEQEGAASCAPATSQRMVAGSHYYIGSDVEGPSDEAVVTASPTVASEAGPTSSTAAGDAGADLGGVGLDEDDIAALAEVARKGYYHGRPLSGPTPPPAQLSAAAAAAASAGPTPSRWDKFNPNECVIASKSDGAAVKERALQVGACRKQRDCRAYGCGDLSFAAMHEATSLVAAWGLNACGYGPGKRRDA